ncbi:unnamed protein product [Rotaria magnacalcarata]|uniref:Uncharacterized protein n=1 Tax=Rotaria magnacalcarata TaxID=392030 RepID=A0A814SEB5_9BILA|nr:unnamed protein product [Rotaria magnacalcarata]
MYEFISYELNRLGLKDCSHAGITTDNASDIKGATECGDFGPRFPCIAHTLNLIINHALLVDDDDDEFIDINDDIIDVEEALKVIELTGNDNNQLNESSDTSATSHIDIESAVLPIAAVGEDQFVSDEDEFDDSSSDLPNSIDNEKKEHFQVLQRTHILLIRTRKLVKIIRSVSVIDQYIRNHQDGPRNGFVIDIRVNLNFKPQQVKRKVINILMSLNIYIRCNSTFFLLKRLLDHQEVVKSVFIHKFTSISSEQRSSLNKGYLDHTNWDLMQVLHDVFQPLELATRSLSGKHYATLALAYTTISILRVGLKPKEDDSSILALFKKSILAQFEFYFDIKMTKTQKELLLVCFFQILSLTIC